MTPDPIQMIRFSLRPVERSDEDILVALLARPEVFRHLGDGVPVPRQAVRESIAESSDRASATSLWLIESRATQREAVAVQRIMIGLVGLRAPMAEATRLRAIGWRSLEVIIALDPAHWGRGFATEAIAAVAAEARSSTIFSLLGLVDVPNARSHRLMHRCGFQELGRIAGKAHPLIVHELLL